MSKTQVTLSDGFQTTITARHHTLHADEPVADGGTDTGLTPSEMVMGALGSCIAITMQMYAQRKGWPLEGVEIELDYERFKGADYELHDGDDRYVHEIRKGIRLQGDLSDEQRQRILDIGGKCPVHRLIATPTYFVEQALAEEDIQS